MLKLIALSFSPWSEKARWALDHHGISYVEIPHTPMLGEPRLRATTKKWTGRVTVPVLVTEDGTVLCDSYEIALYAERHGSGAPLFPRESLNRIAEWNTLADEAMAGARVALVARLARDPEALREGLPPFARSLGAVSIAMGKMAIRFFQKKYDLDAIGAEGQDRYRAALDTIRRGLSEDRSYLLETFSYADITTAAILQAVLPVGDEFIKLGPASREAWTQRDLAMEYADLVAWRDKLYAAYRKPRAARASRAARGAQARA
jgi:glutathione S-transferase